MDPAVLGWLNFIDLQIVMQSKISSGSSFERLPVRFVYFSEVQQLRVLIFFGSN